MAPQSGDARINRLRRSDKRKLLSIVGCSALLLLAATRGICFTPQALQSETRSTKILRAASEGEEFAPEAPDPRFGTPQDPRLPRDKPISQGLREKLMGEATQLGEEDKPVTAGFGNPYLFITLIVVVLGVASYFQLGLDKLDLNGASSGTPAQQAKSDKEMMDKYLKTQEMMYGKSSGF
mmetsp:Transcript_42160/g.68292  ORF Transcript_42160/g.68292 Transcript_42160/m.68292 type:complete len:180 (+) Transcript_42160:89-628(+)|eukprot:CAMPEP_0115109202 /NCGR_PEP_ID=MMETSP0227-20121206/38520_1 /TAXON_ID=89957 /ORGANISM="Polarella glacialis, Strain CCMP 1383" /LENGTH=179 /DNA_ID=CAMNT_0002507765 /DNA_START=84 /DNA_END=623 /DNA_ORIENTATION=-